MLIGPYNTKQYKAIQHKAIAIMANGHENIIPVSQRTTEELREITRKGGIASGIARRERKQLKDRLLILAEGEITNAKGETAAREDIISLQLVNKAIKGDLKAIRLYAQLTGQLVDQLSVNAELSARRAPIFKDLPHPDND